MAIEIRELLVRARVTKALSREEKFITLKEFKRERKKIIEECMDRLRDEFEEFRSGR
jgi:hypothetical protein